MPEPPPAIHAVAAGPESRWLPGTTQGARLHRVRGSASLITVIAQLPDVERGARVASLMRASSTGVALLDISGGMMDLGWADSVAEQLGDVAGRFADGGSHDALVSDVIDRLSEIEHRNRWYATVQLVAVNRAHDSWRIGRIGGARVFADEGTVEDAALRVVGSEDVLALADGPPTIITAALTPRGRWRVDQGPGWAFVDEREAAEQAARHFRVDTVNGRPPLVVVGHPGWVGLAACGPFVAPRAPVLQLGVLPRAGASLSS